LVSLEEIIPLEEMNNETLITSVAPGAERRIAHKPWTCRLTVGGPKAQALRFQNSHWDRRLKAQHGELLETSTGRFVVQFESEAPVLGRLTLLSCRWPKLVLLLQYEFEAERTMGLAKATAGLLDEVALRY